MPADLLDELVAETLAGWQAEASADLEGDDEHYTETMAFVDGLTADDLIELEHEMRAELRLEVASTVMAYQRAQAAEDRQRRVWRTVTSSRGRRRVSRRSSRAASRGSPRRDDDPEPVAHRGGRP